MKTFSKTLLMAGAATFLATGAMANEDQMKNKAAASGDLEVKSSYEDIPEADWDADKDFVATEDDMATEDTSMKREAALVTEDDTPVRELNTTAARAERVINVQQSLNNEGHNLAVDGILGPNTRSALRSFQAQNNMNATGELNQQTLAALNIQTSANAQAAPQTMYHDSRGMNAEMNPSARDKANYDIPPEREDSIRANPTQSENYDLNE